LVSTAEGNPLVFDPYGVEFFNDPYPLYQRLRDECPVYHDAELGFYALSRHDDVAHALKDFETFSSSRGITLDLVRAGQVVQNHIMQMMDPPSHRRMRSLVNKVFTPRAVTSLEPAVRATITRYLPPTGAETFDVVGDFAALFPVEIIAAMLGVDERDRQRVRLWQDVILHRDAAQTGFSEAAMQAMMENREFYHDLIQQRRRRPRDDMLTDLTVVEVDRDDGVTATLSDDEIVGFCMQLGSAGAETVTKLVASAIVVLARHQDQWRALRADRTRVPAAVEEVLRYDGPVQYNCRYTLDDVHLHGTLIPAHSAVMLLVASANRDERAFTDAGTFDIGRDRTEAQNLGLGYGIHSCLGAALARMESVIALNYLLDLMPELEVRHGDVRRVSMTNVNGYSRVPVQLRS
jgi:cytochrome P450